MSCSKCGCSPCKCQSCDPGVFNQPRIFNPQVSGGLFQNGTYQSPIINGGTATGQAINGATIDCTTQVCQQPTGTCNATIASTGFVCVAIQEAISDLNPAFCAAVEGCISNNPAAFCSAVETCINTVNNIINTTLAFGASSRATTAQYGVVRYATATEIENAVCAVAIDPCTLAGVFSVLSNATPFGMAFEMAVNNVLTGGVGLCPAVAACGFAPLNNPVFTGDPQAPTQAPGDNDTSIATTAFVTAAGVAITNAYTMAIADAISALNPAFCAAVLTCGGGGGGGGGGFGDVYATGAFDFHQGPDVLNWTASPVYQDGCVITGFVNSLSTDVTVTLNTPLANDDYTVAVSWENTSTNEDTTWYINPQSAGSFVISLPQVTAFSGIRVHFAVIRKATTLPCSVIQASWAASGQVSTPSSVRILGDDCASYTQQQLGLTANIKGIVTFSWSGLTPLAVGVVQQRNCAISLVAGNNYDVVFSQVQADTNYQIALDFNGVGGGIDAGCSATNTTIINKTVSGFRIDPGPGPVTCSAGGATNVLFSIIR